MKNPKLIFILLAISLILSLATMVTLPAAGSVSNSPLPPYCAGLIAVPAQKYLLEARYIYSRVHDDHLTGYCWQIGDESTSQETFNQFCEIVKWADPTAHCSPGPASLEALKLVCLTWLPVVGR